MTNKALLNLDLIEELLEDYALGKLLEENLDEEYLTLQEAKMEYTEHK